MSGPFTHSLGFTRIWSYTFPPNHLTVGKTVVISAMHKEHTVLSNVNLAVFYIACIALADNSIA